VTFTIEVNRHFMSEEHQKPSGESAFSLGPVESQSSNAGRTLWEKAQSKAVPSVRFSQSFLTLRDMIADAEIDLGALTKVNRLGSGAFAVVDKCVYKTDDGFKREVAVKRLKPDVFKLEMDLHDFVREAMLLRKLSHSHIVDFIGLGADMERARFSSHVPPDCIFLVTEYMNKGTLYSKIVRQMKSSKQIYTVQDGLQWLTHVAKGMKYLHNSNPRVIHRDLKIENVMLTADNQGQITAKIGDFGLHALVPAKKKSIRMSGMKPKKVVKQTSKVFLQQAKSIKQGKKSYSDEVFRLSGKTGSLMYMAPEVLKCEPYNEKADVYSFAIVMYEVLQKCLLLAFVSVHGVASEVDQYIESVVSGFRPFVPKEWPKEIRILLNKCWANSINDRPSMDEVLETLLDIQSKGILVEEESNLKQSGCMCCAQQ